VDKVVHFKKRIVLHLADVDYIDSAGLGALVRIFSGLRVDGGGLKLCRLSPHVMKVLKITNLDTIIPTYETEQEAVDAFFTRHYPAGKDSHGHRTPVVCIDNSADVLAYLNALLTQAGYEVFTTRQINDAKTLVNVIQPRVVIYGPSAQKNKSAIERISQSVPHSQALFLPEDFSTSEASEAGIELVGRVRAAAAN
jgi:hypothetical protein